MSTYLTVKRDDQCTIHHRKVNIKGNKFWELKRDEKILYYFILISSFFMIIGGISKVSQDGLTFPDIFMFIIFISLITFSIVKLFKHKNLDYKSNKSNNNHKKYLILIQLNQTTFNQIVILRKIMSHVTLKSIIVKK